MKKITYIVGLFAFLLGTTQVTAQQNESWRSAAPKAGPAPTIEIQKPSEFELPNGLKVIVVENHKLPRISYRLFVDAPKMMEGDMAGYVDFMGQLMNKGTSTKKKAEIDEAVDFMGAYLSTNAAGFYASALTKHNESLLEIIADVVKNPSFPEDEFQKGIKQTLSGLAQAKDSPEAIASNVSSVLTYGKDHPYGEVTTEETVKNITLDQIKAYYKKYFKPNWSYLIVVGDTNTGEVKKNVAKYLGDWEKGPNMKPNSYPQPKAPSATTVDFVNKNGAVQSVINITYPVDLKPGSEDAIKASVMNTLLGGFFKSRLNDNLRETKGYTYGARSSLNADKVIGSFKAYASVRNEVTDSSLVEFMNEIGRLRTEKVSDEEMSLVKSVMAGNFARSLEKPETVARFALNSARYNLPEDYFRTYLEKLSQVTAADVQAMAKKYLLPENAHILIVGNKDEVADKLARFSKDGKVHFYDAYGNPVEDLGNATPANMTAASVLEGYIQAIGGDKVKNVKTIHSISTAEIQGAKLTIESYQTNNDKMYTKTTMQGNVMEEMVISGGKVQAKGMMGAKLLEGEDAKPFLERAVMFPELLYEKMGCKLELKGMEAIGDKKAYKILVENPAGVKTTHFFDVDSKLKLQSISEEATVSYDEYKEVEGIKLPLLMTVKGGQIPFPLEMKVQTVEVNKTVDAALFEIK